MFLLRFTHEENDYLLHGGVGEGFIGAETEEGAHVVSAHHIGKSIGVGGFTVVEMSIEELAQAVGFSQYDHPFYDIIDFSGGLGIPFCAVEIVK